MNYWLRKYCQWDFRFELGEIIREKYKHKYLNLKERLN